MNKNNSRASNKVKFIKILKIKKNQGAIHLFNQSNKKNSNANLIKLKLKAV